MRDEHMELFSNPICPYAHRTRLVLLEKNVPFDLIEIDLKNKPKRFLEVSLYGKVPALVHEAHTIYESAIINEYLEEVFPNPPLMPRDPAERAKLRIWVDYCDDYFLSDHYALLKNQDAALAPSLMDRAMRNFAFIEEQGLARLSGGPFWLGQSASLLDFAWYPFFERLPAWKHYRGLRIPAGCRRLEAWLAAMSALPSVRRIAASADFYIAHYAAYAKRVIGPAEPGPGQS
jgi:glutathione S-transferase